MSESIGSFPSGQSIRKVTQTDRTPKRVFVLGVYASAVHARWIGQDGKTRIAALAVASEPEIFWTGEGSEQLIATITPPNTIGTLKSAGQNLNGPSGRALDKHILEPLGLTRKDAWLCDLVPHSCMNPGQEAALKREGLPVPDWPRVPECLADAARRSEIMTELTTSEAQILITLGDLPLFWFARHLGSKPRLSNYGADISHYGQAHTLSLPDRTITLIPLAHPRQIARLGAHSAHWASLHASWQAAPPPHLPSLQTH
jgi:uracil-DNA glycosylase